MKFHYLAGIITLMIFSNLSYTKEITASSSQTETAIFAGGCFWCIEADFDKVPGVIQTISGYTGGEQKNPTYEEVSSGQTNHYESVKIVFDPHKISYQQLLDVFWHSIDPTDAKGQFCDKGKQYRAVIFYLNDSQKKLAIESKEALIQSQKFNSIVTNILPATTFYPAENYHQNYYKKNPIRYKFYRYTCGRDQKLKKLWGK